MTEYTHWKEIPEHLKTKNSLIKMGIYKTASVVAVIKTNSGTYELFDVNQCLALEQQKGNKMLNIDSMNQNGYLIMEMATTGDSKSDEIVQLVLLDMNGQLLLNQYFKPQTEISKTAIVKHQINKFYLKQQPQWDECWGKVKEFIKGKTLLIPNTSYGTRLFRQTCERYGTEIDFELNVLCSRETIQHKFSLLSLFSLPENEVQNPLKDSFETLKILYPKSPLYQAQTMAKNYFDRLCQYKIRQGDNGAYDKGFQWLQKEFRLSSDELEFDTMDYRICIEIVESLINPLKGLGLL
jgi:DNA polymerase III epsilon subunit-like protein